MPKSPAGAQHQCPPISYGPGRGRFARVSIAERRDKRDALTTWNHFAESIRQRLRLHFPREISPNHPVISARPYKVFLYDPDQVWDRTEYVEQNPPKEKLPLQRWKFVILYDIFPFHKSKDAMAKAQAKRRALDDQHDRNR